MVLDTLPVPIVLAPLAGGPSSPELAAAVARAGGLGFIAGGYLPTNELRARIREARELCAGPYGVNLFVPGAGPAGPSAYGPYIEHLRRTGVEPGEPRFSDDEWDAKLLAVIEEELEVVSFTFGCPPAEVISRVRDAGSEAWVTVSTPHEARQAVAAGADALVVQGIEAGGHRAAFVDRPDLTQYALLPLLALVRAAVEIPLVASGGIMDGDALAAVLCAGARAAQLGSAFLLAPEAGTAAAHRAALAQAGETVLTRAFTGRLARGIRNRFIEDHDAQAPLAYPEVHYATAPLRRRAREDGDPGLINLWAGEAHELARARPAAEIVAEIAAEARAAVTRAQAVLQR